MTSAVLQANFRARARGQHALLSAAELENLNANTIAAHLTSDYIVSSPYTTPSHFLYREKCSDESFVLARALESLRSITPDYATVAYENAFNWEEVVSGLPESFEGTYYCVAFYSQLSPSAAASIDTLKNLHSLDELAHEEANAAGGLLKYWFGSHLDHTSKRNIATCLWESPELALTGGKGRVHSLAMKVIAESYSFWSVERYSLQIRSSVTNRWSLTKIEKLKNHK
jgi:hypothetical protein